MPWHHAIVLYLWLSEVLLVLTLLSAPEHCYGQALPAVRFLAALGASADNNGIYSSLDTNLLPAGSVVLQALSPLQSTAIRLCNISIIGSPRGSTLDISAAQGQLDIFRLATGEFQTGTLACIPQSLASGCSKHVSILCKLPW